MASPGNQHWANCFSFILYRNKLCYHRRTRATRYVSQNLVISRNKLYNEKSSPYSITERRVPELIPVLGSQPAGDVSHKPAVGCHYFPQGLQLPPQPLRGMLPILLLGEQRHDGCEQFALDCYPTASRMRFEPGPFCAWVQHANHSATEPQQIHNRSRVTVDRLVVDSHDWSIVL